MASEVETNPRMFDFAELKKLLGPAPILASESEEAYDAMLRQFLGVVKPEDFLGVIFARDLTDQTWEMNRAGRNKALSVERKERLHREAQANKIASDIDRRAIREKLINASNTQDRVDVLEEYIDKSSSDIKELLARPWHGGDEARAMEAAINLYESFDGFYGSSFSRRRQTIQDFTLYNELLQHQARIAAEAPVKRVLEAPKLSPDTPGE